LPLAAAAAAVLVVAGLWVRRRDWIAWPAGAAGLVSLAATATTLPRGLGDDKVAGVCGLAECAALLLLTVAVTRWAPRRQGVAAVLAAGAAVSVCLLRFLPSRTPLDVVGACALWSAGPVAAVVVGGYPRLAEQRRQRSVAAAQQAQRLALARDLHDFVAHDISGIVAQAQAARFVADTDPQQALTALERIETAGLQALAAMDRAVHMLHATPAEGRDTKPAPLPGLADLPVLVERFAAAGPARVHFDLDQDLVLVAPREVGTTLYRVVTEALTNIRRHAPTATAVRACVHRAPGPAVAVSITNNGPPGRSHPRPLRTGQPGGFGLAGLREQVHALGGTLTAGPYADGWRVMASLPVPDNHPRT